MEQDDLSKYEQIRSIASRDWLKPASVSLAKLDQVRARVYNLGIAEQGQLRAKPGHLSSRGVVSGLQSQPPLHNVNSQLHAWGSNASIPDLIRQQSLRQKHRPESAKQTRKTRPVSAKRVRPQSAKEPCRVPLHTAVAQSYGVQDGSARKPPIAVKGAKYDPNERPPEGIRQCPASSGWVAPPGGLCEFTDAEFDATLDEFMNEQDGVDPIDMEENAEGRDSVLGKMVADIIQKHAGEPLEEKVRKPRKKLLRRPPEPIHFSLPTATMDPDDDEFLLDDESSDAESEREVNGLGPIIWDETEKTEVGEHIVEDGEKKEKMNEHVNLTLPMNHVDQELEISDAEDEMVDLDRVDEELAEYEQQREMRERNLNRSSHHVKFAIDKNETVDITPRNVQPTAEVAPKVRSYSGRADLRNIKSRTDSGIVLNSEAPEPSPGTTSKASRKSPAASGKPTPPPAPRISKVSVHIMEELDDQSHETGKKHKKRPLRAGPPEVESMMSHLALSDTEGEIDTDKEKNEENVLTTKSVSVTEKNYYDVAMTNARPNSCVGPSGDGDVQKMKTVKTFQFSEEGLKEEKCVSELGTQALPSKVPYTAPRPRSAVSKPSSTDKPAFTPARPSSAVKPASASSRPPSAAKPTSAPSRPSSTAKTSKDSVEPPRHVNTEADSTDDKENKATLCEEDERPSSRMGFIQDSSKNGGYSSDGEHTSNGKQDQLPRKPQRRRLWSAPASRPQTKPISVKQRPASAFNKPSTNKANQNNPAVVTKPSVREARRANAAARAIRNGEPEQSRLYETERFYSSYSKPPPKAVGLAKRRLEEAKEVKPVEIWSRPNFIENMSEGVEECRDIQDQLLDNGVPVTLEALSRALLPPTSYCFNEYTVVNPRAKEYPSNTAGLISKPCYWLPEEHKKVQEAKKLVRMATQQLMEQEAEERRLMAEFEASLLKKKRRKGKKKRGKSGKKGKKKAAKTKDA